MKKNFWNEEVQKSIEKLNKRQLQELLMDIWDTATVIYADETDTERIEVIEDSINKLIGYK